MPTYAAGQRIRASDINALPHTYYMRTDQAVINSTVLVDASGLFFPVDANTYYAIDCWLLYNAHPTGQFKCGLRLPTGTTGQVGLLGPAGGYAPANASAPRINYIDFGAFNVSGGIYSTHGDQQFPGQVFIGAMMRGWLLTGNTAGTVQFQFAQNVAYNPLATTLKLGSWIRLDKME